MKLVVVMAVIMAHMEILKGKDTYFQQLAVLGGAKEKPKRERESEVRGRQKLKDGGGGVQIKSLPLALWLVRAQQDTKVDLRRGGSNTVGLDFYK